MQPKRLHGPPAASLVPGVTVHRDKDRGLVACASVRSGGPQAPTSSMKAKRKDRVPGKGAVKILPYFIEVTMVTQRLKPPMKRNDYRICKS